jgi:hypothetical protein
MMFFPNSYPSATFDPIERDRVESGRPTSRMEVLQHQQRAMHHDRIVMAVTNPEDANSDQRSVLHLVPDALTGIRRSLSRVLASAGQRIGPEAA